MPAKTDPAALATALVNGQPLAFKQYPDGAIVVIGPTGQKYRFTPDQVQAKLAALTPAPQKRKKKPVTPAPKSTKRSAKSTKKASTKK